MKKLDFISFDKKYVKELNQWQNKENMLGLDGLNQYVVLLDSLLGDYLQFIDKEMSDISCKLVLKDENLVGFLCFSQQDKDHVHVEVMGVNPDFRGKGISGQLLTEFKQKLLEKHGLTKLTLSVNKNNDSGIRSFSKIGTKSQTQNKPNYINYEI